MIHKLFLLLTVLKTFSSIKNAVGYVALHLGEECKFDRECIENDPNSQCSSHSQRLHCVCKLNYRVDVVNNTEKCIYSSFEEEEKEGLTAAPIILCFLVCVLVEAFCLLAFRYWKKHRRSDVMSHGALHMQTVTLSEFTRFSHSRNDHISFTITPERESVSSSIQLSSPPPYCQTIIVGLNMNSQKEDPPPAYDEAVKKNSSSILLSDEHTHRKMSC